MMSQRRKLKKGQINLLTWKNKIRNFICFILFVGFIFGFPSRILAADSSGVSFIWSYAKILDYYHDLSLHSNEIYMIYQMDGGLNNQYNPVSISKSEGFHFLLRIPYKYGYSFEGWYWDKDYRYPVTKIDSYQNCMIYAKWARNIDNYSNVSSYQYQYENAADSKMKLLKNLEFSFLEDLHIPGMPATKEEDLLNEYIFSESQCPQGICTTKDFILMTSYSEEDDCLGELMVFDKETGKFLLTLGMDSQSHLGGVAYDGENVWVCNSKNKTIERISYDVISLLAYENTGKVVDATQLVDIYKVKNTPSCITYHEGRLWIATHNIIFQSDLYAYYYDSDHNKLKTLSGYKIPSKVQGIAFDSKDRVFLSTSYGRRESSFLKIYSSVIDLSSKPGSPKMSVELPPGSEEIDIDGDDLYMVFESAGEKYLMGTDGKGTSASPIDEILKIKKSSIFGTLSE